MARSRRAPTTIQKLLFRTDKWTPTKIRLWVAQQPASRHFTAAKIEEKPIDYHVRQRDPEDFVPGSYRTIPLGKNTGILAVIGHLRPGLRD